ncbi:hypothetical protein OAP83_00970 [Rickettsiales bacterium]|nr:hypothetical protein [Rickettsiales bacterium]
MIIFFDLTRPPFCHNSIHIKYAKHIHQLFQWQIQKVSNKKIKIINFDFEEKGGVSRQRFYSLMNLEYIEKNWAKIYDAKPTSNATEYIAKFIPKDSLILSYETSPILIKIFDIIKVNYIDIRVSSIKYLDDLMFGFKTNNPQIFNKLIKYKTPEDQYFFEASLIKSRNIVANNIHLEENSALFLEQTVSDASLIKNGKILNVLDFRNQFIQKTKDFNVIYYKKHPYQKSNSVDYKFITKFKNVKLIDDNIYKILSNESIKECFSISSGVLQEAKYFNKKTDCFFKPMYDFLKDEESVFSDKKYISVYNKALEPNFWSDVLSPVVKTTKCNNIVLYSTQSRIRYLHNLYWGYQNKSSESINKLSLKFDKLNDRRIIKKLNKFIKNLKNYFK